MAPHPSRVSRGALPGGGPPFIEETPRVSLKDDGVREDEMIRTRGGYHRLRVACPTFGPRGAELVHVRGPPTRSDNDSGVLARIVRLVDAYDEPGTCISLQQVTRLEDPIGEPVLPMAVGKEDGQRAGQLSPSAPPGAMAQARVTAKGELSR